MTLLWNVIAVWILSSQLNLEKETIPPVLSFSSTLHVQRKQLAEDFSGEVWAGAGRLKNKLVFASTRSQEMERTLTL